MKIPKQIGHPAPVNWAVISCTTCKVKYCAFSIDKDGWFYREFCSSECQAIYFERSAERGAATSRKLIAYYAQKRAEKGLPPKVDVEIVRVPLPPRTCRNCGEDFVPRSSINVFCCWDCNTQWHAERSPKRRTYFRILERDGFRCIYCGRSSIADGVKLALDHIHPHSRGGEDIASNLVTACFDCNSRKGARKVRKGVVQQVIWIVEQRNEQHGIQPNSPVEAFEHRPRSDRRD